MKNLITSQCVGEPKNQTKIQQIQIFEGKTNHFSLNVDKHFIHNIQKDFLYYKVLSLTTKSGG